MIVLKSQNQLPILHGFIHFFIFYPFLTWKWLQILARKIPLFLVFQVHFHKRTHIFNISRTQIKPFNCKCWWCSISDQDISNGSSNVHYFWISSALSWKTTLFKYSNIYPEHLVLVNILWKLPFFRRIQNDHAYTPSW